MNQLLSTKEVAQFLNINEKKVYALVSEKSLPATKITGKWLFPKHLIEQWVETNTLNYPEFQDPLQHYQRLLIITGSNDLLLDRVISLFNTFQNDHIAVFGNLGSMGGLHALRRNLCHIASSHLIQDDEAEYNFEYAFSELTQMPAVINFCRREQGILIQKDNPKQISKVDDFARKGIQIVNRSLGTGTRLLLDRQLKHAGIDGNKIDGYAHEVSRHLDVGLEVISGRADAGLGIRTVADLLDLDFIPLLWERYDLLVAKDRFFDEDVQRFIGLLHEKQFFELAKTLKGYDLSSSGKMIFPQDQKKGEGKRNNT